MGALAEDVVVRAGFDLSADLSRTGGPDLRGVWRGWVERMLHDAEREGHLAEGLSSHGAPRRRRGHRRLRGPGRGRREWLSAPKITGFWELMLPRLAPAGHRPAGPRDTTTHRHPIADTRPVSLAFSRPHPPPPPALSRYHRSL
ncbi:hypothetical protein [Streptomyces sp. Tu 2975]|uniref:hypothetical protein n=1 Tax=Streptomyces sp. Tu 2975 TaxID=2676871 RepID=UPI001FCA182A|nr:hypothetical protein [Streptomyces sp. Tu 2975]